MTVHNVMPHSIVALSPDQALEDGLWWLKTRGVVNDSRNGRVLVSPVPVITAYPEPRCRVLSSPLRDANPFFHFFESLWMLAGKNEAASVANYAKQMETFADDGLLWGAYGFRWRHFFAFDQLAELVEMLKRDPKTRRAVLTMWSPNGDLVATDSCLGGPNAKDVPCNTQVYFDLSSGRLNMTVTNRSNDIVWGAYGANVVHMSYLHEFMAAAVDCQLGTYYQFSNNYHMYIDRPDCQRLLAAEVSEDRSQWHVKFKAASMYVSLGIQPAHLLIPHGDWRGFLMDCEKFVQDPANTAWSDHHNLYIAQVAAPMMQAHAAYKAGRRQLSKELCTQIASEDWSIACIEWLQRREPK
jgi:hypothetical protein